MVVSQADSPCTYGRRDRCEHNAPRHGPAWVRDAAGSAAVPTLAEVKRGSNPEIRRAIVGQLLEYAAHASETWTAEELCGMFERQSEARGRNAEAELAALLQTDGDPEVDEF